MNEIDVKKIRIELNMSQGEFANAVGYSRSAIQKWENGERNPDERAIFAIENFLKTHTSVLVNNEEPNSTVEKTNIAKNKEFHGVPYYENIDGTATISTSFSDYTEKPTFYIDYEHFNDCSAYVNVVGDSMYPAYCSGDIIAVKRIFNFDVIQWGEAYFVVTNASANDMKTVKQLHWHEDDSKIILRSSNPNYKGDTVVNKKDILFLYIVKGKIKRNQL